MNPCSAKPCNVKATPCVIGVDKVAAKPVTCKDCVDGPKDFGIVSC